MRKRNKLIASVVIVVIFTAAILCFNFSHKEIQLEITQSKKDLEEIKISKGEDEKELLAEEETKKNEESKDSVIIEGGKEVSVPENSNIKDGAKGTSFLGFSVENANQYWNDLLAVAKHGTSFYQNYVDSLGLLSKTGKAYNSKADMHIDVPYLCRNTGLDMEYIDFSCDVLLIKGSDLAKYESMKVQESSMGFGIFTAAKQPNGKLIMLSSSEGKVGMMPEEDYRRFLKSYTQEHGKIKRLSSAASEFQRILNFIRVHEGKYDEYFVRETKVDEKYAFVTLSPKEDPLDINQYILVNNNGFWEVALNGIEKEYYLEKTINSALPDFNLNMIPNYNISEYKNDFKADFSDVFKNMIYNELISDVSQVYYKSGTSNHCYIVLYNKDKFYGVRKNGIWNITKVDSDLQALEFMKASGIDIPSFILLDE